MPLVASTGPVLVRCWQHRPSTGPVLAHNGMFMGSEYGVVTGYSNKDHPRDTQDTVYIMSVCVCVLLNKHLITCRSNISASWGLNDFKIWADLVRSVWLPHNEALMSIAFLDFLRVFVHGPTFWILYVWFDHFDLPFAFYVFNGLITLGRANCVATDSVASLLESGNSKL